MTTAAASQFSCFVRGIPAPQGSKKGFVSGGHVNIVDTNPMKLKDWRTAINFVLQDKWEGPPLEGPVSVTLTFDLPRPVSVSVKKRRLPHVKPDLDKLVRAAFDAMTGICFKDDAQVTSVHASKSYGAETGLQLWIHSIS